MDNGILFFLKKYSIVDIRGPRLVPRKTVATAVATGALMLHADALGMLT